MNKTKKSELVHGSGNVFRDFADPNADIEQLKAILAGKIIGILTDRKLSVRKAQAISKVPAADFSRIRNADLKRFTADRLISILNKLDQRVNVSVEIFPQPKQKRPTPQARPSMNA